MAPPSSAVGAPGYDAPPGSNGHTGISMGPPALPPVVIPQNNNTVGSPTSLDEAMSPSSGGVVRRAAPEPNKRALYVGGLDPRVTEDVLKQIFETTGHVVSVKVIPDKNQFNTKGLNYGFVEYDDPGAAERAMNTLNSRRVHQAEIRVNWAYQSNSSNKEDTSNHFHIFVGDLSNEVNDEVLLQAFSTFGSVSEARVMWDMKTGRTRGYGFVAFRERQDAEKALASMDGEWLGSRAIRCNWANQKGQPSISQQQAMAAMGMTPTTPFGHHHFPTQGVQSYEMVANQTPSWQTTCYVGNLTPYTTQADLIPLFQNFGYVVETRFQSDRGFAFVKMDTHENAAMAICQLSGYNVNGRPLKCSWGKDRPPTSQFDTYSPQTSIGSASTPGGYNPASPYFPQYGGPGPLTPQGKMRTASMQNMANRVAGPSPGGRGNWDSNHMPSPYTQSPQSAFGQAPPSAGGYGRAPGPPVGMYPQPPATYGNSYPGYQP
ncbi:nucleolin [Exophiala viscosa]|uniref:nucleolin n=1 Tax=Exophiala viscosa TaxID=2486360 RepID=UPI002194A6D6|nr:nucleolin [Exophiala viscosa]